jgi:RimJ/RimL family protein N-acetyltransferase
MVSRPVLPLLTARLEIRDFVRDDRPALHAYASDPRVTRYLWWGPFDEADTLRFLERTARDAQASPRESFELGVVDRERGLLIGGCELLSRRQSYREYEIGYCLRPDCWGRGIATETVRALLELAFGSLGAHRIYALVDPENLASGRLLARIGFRLEGHLRKDSFIRGEWRDSLVYALLAEEWSPSLAGPGVKTA